MPFQLGNKISKGRPQGTPNKDKQLFRDTLEKKLGSSAIDVFVDCLNKIQDPEKKASLIAQTFPYMYSKLQSTTIEIEEGHNPVMLAYPDAILCEHQIPKNSKETKIIEEFKRKAEESQNNPNDLQ